MDVRTRLASNGGYWVEKFGDHWRNQVTLLQVRFAAKIEDVHFPDTHPTDMPTIFVATEAIVDVLVFLKTAPECAYDFLSDITAVDNESDPRFEVVYHLYSMAKKCRIRVKVRVAEGREVPTAVAVWPAADWAEREVWDMFGIRFAGHPDLRRILMDMRWEGHPLRKDYPIRGYQIFTTPEPIDPTLLNA